LYDIYFGTDSTATTLLAPDQPLGPSETTTQMQTYTLPTLTSGTTYYWKVVSKTAALVTKAGPIWSFSTEGTAEAAAPPPTGAATMRIFTTSSAEFVQQDGTSDTSDHGWGWADNGWGAIGVNVYFATTGTHTVRVQQREDGAIVDQIVLSPTTYLSASPGRR